MIQKEKDEGVFSKAFYSEFNSKAELAKNNFLQFLIQAKRNGKRVAGYGAAAKGNTLLNWAGVKKDLIEFVVDSNVAKQGKYLPGSRIPILAPAHLRSSSPEIVVVLPWNLSAELRSVSSTWCTRQPDLVSIQDFR
jgi:hypothetical protein